MKKKISKYLSLFFVFMLLIPVNIYAEKADSLGSKIQYTIIQPEAVYSVAPGDTLKYVLKVILPTSPKELAKEVKNFTVTVKIDKDLHTEKVSLRELKPIDKKIGLTMNRSEKSPNNTVSFIVKDIEILGDKKEFNIDIETKAKKGMKGEVFTNSAVLTYESKDGEELSNGQKDISSNTKKSNGRLKITNAVYDDTSEIKGQTEKNAIVKIFLQNKEIAKGKSDEQGNYVIKIQPLEVGTHLKVVSYFNDGKDTKIADHDLEVLKEEKTETIVEDIKKDEEVESLGEKSYTLETLKDYLDMAKGLNTRNVSKEDSARLKAAIAYGDYIRVKTDQSLNDFKEAIDKLYEATRYIRKPYMNGYSENKFGPNDKMTRAQSASVLARIIKGEDPKGEFSSFKDVAAKKWYAESIAFMEKEKIINGYNDNTFKPEKEITRAEFAKILTKIVDLDAEDNIHPIEFKDIKENHWAKKSIDIVTSQGLMKGREKEKFAPNEPITRTEVATVLNKLQKRTPNEEFIKNYSKNPFKDLKENFWGYCEVLEATGY